MTSPSLPWIRGVPSVEAVATHAKAHPFGQPGHPPAGLWLCLSLAATHPAGTIAPAVRVLRVVDLAEGRTGVPFVAFGEIGAYPPKLAWRQVDGFPWADQGLWLPCAPDGIPVHLLGLDLPTATRRAVEALHAVGAPAVAEELLADPVRETTPTLEWAIDAYPREEAPGSPSLIDHLCALRLIQRGWHVSPPEDPR